MEPGAHRELFPTLARMTYLNTCSLGALSDRSRAAVNRFMDEWTDLGASAWYELWMSEIRGVRRKFARLVGAREEEIAWAPSASQALASLASALDYAERDEVVVTDLEFPTLPQQWGVRRDATLSWVPSPDGVRVPATDIANAVTDDTLAVATSRVYYATGFVQDVKAVTRAAHDAGALSIVDDYQGTAQLPIDVKDVGCDALVTGSLKWMCGGPGSCFMYVRRDLLRDLEPTITGWWGNRHMFDFDVKKHAWPDDARRFEMGEVNMPGVAASSPALDLLLEIGPDRIHRATQALVQDLLDRLRDAKFEVASPLDERERSGIVMVRMADPKKAVAGLARDGIIVDDRPGKVRISPYYYNTYEENERIVDALKAQR